MSSENLLLKYRPGKLDDVLGQPEVVRPLQQFVKEPYAIAMLFHGESGIGKTATAHALARDLGCNADEEELGGLHEIASGEQSADMVREMMNLLRMRPLFGSGWKVLIVNECDRMSPQAEAIWLDGLEHLPGRSVVVFTTNCPEQLSKRFRDRCEVYHFESDSERLAPAIQSLCKWVWKEEVGKGTCPALDSLGMPTLGSLETMNASFRLGLQQIARYIREAKHGSQKNLARVRKQVEKDLLVTGPEIAFQAACDHCGHEQAVGKEAGRHVCEECGKTFKVE